MHRHLGTITLRNPHKVYETDLGFEVTQVDLNGVEYTYTISHEAADFLCAICKGKFVTAGEASAYLEPYAKKLNLTYHYGPKLRYYTQEILLVLAATGRATIRKAGRGFKYQVEG